jgi:hypothetical protein
VATIVAGGAAKAAAELFAAADSDFALFRVSLPSKSEGPPLLVSSSNSTPALSTSCEILDL